MTISYCLTPIFNITTVFRAQKSGKASVARFKFLSSLSTTDHSSSSLATLAFLATANYGINKILTTMYAIVHFSMYLHIFSVGKLPRKIDQLRGELGTRNVQTD